MPANVTIYTTRYCGYCVAAKRLLDKKNATYQEVSAEDRDDLRQWLVEASSQRTVPQLFVNGRSIGGYDELSGLERAGRLDALLAEPPSAADPELRR